MLAGNGGGAGFPGHDVSGGTSAGSSSTGPSQPDLSGASVLSSFELSRHRSAYGSPECSLKPMFGEDVDRIPASAVHSSSCFNAGAVLYTTKHTGVVLDTALTPLGLHPTLAGNMLPGGCMFSSSTAAGSSSSSS